MILFVISFLLVIAASYFIASIFAENKSEFGIIYLLISAFANVVLTFEILSLFSAISIPGVLILNILTLAASLYFWNRSGRPVWNFSDAQGFFRNYLKAVKLDKSLIVLSVGFAVLIFVSLFLMSFMPLVNIDAGSYHVLRSVEWVLNKNLNHFQYADIRALAFPINSEIVYAWIILFIKKLAWFGFVSFAGFILSVTALYNIFSLMKFSMRRKLWIIFMLCSFAAVIVQISGTETDIIITGLVSSSLFLYWYAVKNNKKIPVFFSALAYALAVGTKTPAIMAIPAVGAFMIGLSIFYLKKDFYKPFCRFLFYAVFNFIIFASYNYILNLIDFGNIAGSDSMMRAHANYYGLRAIPANFIKYIFMFFDFTGFHWADYWGAKLTEVREALLAFIGLADIKDGIYNSKTIFNKSLLEPMMGLGILGIIVYLPCWFWSLIKPVFARKKTIWFLFAFGAMLVINIIVMSLQLQFMVYSIRFLMFFCLLSAPVLYYSYCKKNNIYKVIVILFALYYMTLVSTHIWARPFFKVLNYFRHGYTLSEVRETATCSAFIKDVDLVPRGEVRKEYYNEPCTVVNYIRENISKENRILFFAHSSTDVILLKMLNFQGYHVDFGVMENINNINIDSYNIIMTVFNDQFATNVKDFEARKSDIYISPITKKIYFRRNEETPCFYMSTNYRIITDLDNTDQRPYIMRCMLTDAFYKQHNFRKIDELDVEVPPNNNEKELITYGYYFYENMNNPMKK